MSDEIDGVLRGLGVASLHAAAAPLMPGRAKPGLPDQPAEWSASDSGGFGWDIAYHSQFWYRMPTVIGVVIDGSQAGSGTYAIVIQTMASEYVQDFPRLQETVTDGRLANVFFRREQLFQLQDALRRNEDDILDGILKDSGNTPAEALAELYMTASTLKSLHDQLKPNEELELEYRVANGQDAPATRVGVGIVVIVPQRHTFVYSALAPLCSAIAAGNCAVVVVSRTPKLE